MTRVSTKSEDQQSLKFKIATLWGNPEGSTEKHKIDKKLIFDPKEIKPATNLKADLMIIKLKDELSAILSDLTIGVLTNCSLCLKEFKQKIEISGAERQFLAKAPATVDDPSDLFLIDTKPMTIDLYEMVRQEIILHFAPFPVCSDSCKGLCQHCGTNKNEKKCSCKAEDLETQKPFKNLKKLINN